MAATTPLSSLVSESRRNLGQIPPGTILVERYRIIRFIAGGGMGDVYEVEDGELGERVALKTVRDDLADSANGIERFKREIQLARKVTHENVCRIFDVGVHRAPGAPGMIFLTMELLDGEPLSETLRRRGPLPTDEAAGLMAQIAAGLDAAHRAGVIHRDLKPHNVMLCGTPPRAVVTDFGLARATSTDDSSQTGPEIVGSPAYMAPEQVTGGAISAATDVFALGVVGFEMVTGKLPFLADTPLATAALRIERDAPDAGTFVPSLPAAWRAALRRALAREPAKRFAAAGELAAAVQTKPRRPRWLVPAVAIAALAVVALVVALVLPGRSGREPVQNEVSMRDAPAPTGTPLERATAYLERVELQHAIDVLEPALAAAPDDIPLRLKLLGALMLLREHDRASEEIARLRRDTAALSDEQKTLLDALDASMADDMVTAAALFQKIFVAHPSLTTGDDVVSALTAAGNPAEAEIALATLRNLPDVPPDHPQLAFLEGYIAEARGDYPGAVAAFTRAAAAAEARGWRGWRAFAIEQRAYDRTILGQFPDVVADGEAALADVTAIGDEHRSGGLLNTLAITGLYTGHYTHAVAYADRAIEVSRTVGDPLNALVASGNRGLALLFLGDLDGADAVFADIRRALGPSELGTVELWEGMAAIRRGDFDKAERHLAASVANPQTAPALRTLALWQLGESAWRRGDPPAARKHLDDCIESAGRMGMPFARAVCRIVLAEVLLGDGRAIEAEATARQSVTECDTMGVLDYGARARVTLARVLRARGASEADLMLAAAAARANHAEDPMLVLEVQGERARVDGDAAALETVRRAAAEKGYGALAR